MKKQSNLSDINKALPPKINIIGNAKNLLNQNLGEIIDRLPTIRFNRIRINNPSHQGNRWDFLASSEIKTFNMYNQITPDFHTLIFTPYLDTHLSHLNLIRFQSNILTLNLNFSKELMYKIGFKPSTGLQILSLMDLLKRDVNIFGFDWKKTPTIYDEKRTQDPHNYFIEKKIALNLIRKNNWNLF